MGGPLTGPTSTTFARLFIPSVCVLIAFLGYTSQWLLNTAAALEPGPLTKRETTIFNILLACVWATYYKACTVPPGRYTFPANTSLDDRAAPTNSPLTRWCKKCAAPKPPRTHHCRLCAQCIPKMDHHCPWTGQCVSLQTFPPFLRFLLYANLALTYLHAALLYPRLRALFSATTTPAHLGPRLAVMIHLVLLALVGGVTSLLLLIMLVTSARGWLMNQTMIEGWEIERHAAVLARARRTGGTFWESPSNTNPARAARVERVEFPYDLSFFENMAQAMGTRNVLAWLDPFVGCYPVVAPYPYPYPYPYTSTPTIKGQETKVDTTGWEYEENGFNDRTGMWPPPDPDKLRRGVPGGSAHHNYGAEIAALEGRWADPRREMEAFRARQAGDVRRQGGFVEAEEVEDEDEGYEYVDGGSSGGGGYEDEESDEDEEVVVEEEVRRGKSSRFEAGIDGEPGWTNAEGDRLRDFGVDEDAEEEEEDDENVPLGELLRRRRAYQGVEA